MTEEPREDMNLDAMYGQNHEIHHEFPQFAKRIDELAATDSDFAKLVADYNEINRQVIRIEQNIEVHSHAFVEDLKKERLRHLDMLYARLRR